MSKFLITAQGKPFDTIEEANKVAREAGRNGPIYVCQVIGIWRPVTEPVEFVPEFSPLEMNIVGLHLDPEPDDADEQEQKFVEEVALLAPKAPPTDTPISSGPTTSSQPSAAPSGTTGSTESVASDKPRRGRPPKNQSNQIQVRAEPIAVIEDHNPFADLTGEQPEKPSTVLIIDPKAGGMAQGEWKCPDCGAACFASQRQCACGTKRVMTQTTSDANGSLADDGSAPQGVEESAAALKLKERAKALAILAHRVGDDDEKCRRCRGPVITALVNGWRVMICNKDGCHASKETLATYNNLYGDPLANEPELPKFSPAAEGKSSNHQPEAAAENPGIAAALEKRQEILAEIAGGIPDEDAIEISTIYLGRRIETPPAEWEGEPITDEGGEGGGGQLKALNTALSEIGYGGDLRHRACVGILGQIRELGSLKDLSKAEAHILLSWLDLAGPEDIAELAKVAGPQKVRI